ncbi:MAG: flagellar biosynthesis anti-sigma factor FlgM [Phycisphaeraceae bacterium]|nr:flagellar biosynthesis anti-sigma factor FlgM [Phycisphaeraceae bacterium]
MSDISPITQPGAATLGQVRAAARPATAVESATRRQRDQVELSVTAQMLSKIADLPDVRTDLVNQVRSQIAAGTYETPEKLNSAIDALLAEEFGL